MDSPRKNWLRVSKAKPCPICEHFDWCLQSADGSVAICARTESAKRCGDAGWLHRLRDDPWQPPPRYVRTVCVAASMVTSLDFAALAKQFQAAVNPVDLHVLAQSLGLSVDSLHRLDIGWSTQHRAWSFPMSNTAGEVLGIRLRRPNGFKFSVTGGKEGLFLPAGQRSKSRLLICEGPTDTAALLDMGFTNVVGRPSCTGGIKLLVELVRQRDHSDVVIVADGDEPGRRGADNLASALLAYARTVRVINPPNSIKDARAWLRNGGTWADVEQMIQAAAACRLVVQTRKVR